MPPNFKKSLIHSPSSYFPYRMSKKRQVLRFALCPMIYNLVHTRCFFSLFWTLDISLACKSVNYSKFLSFFTVKIKWQSRETIWQRRLSQVGLSKCLQDFDRTFWVVLLLDRKIYFPFTLLIRPCIPIWWISIAVLGDIAPDQLGRTLTHEHLSMRFDVCYVPPKDEKMRDLEWNMRNTSWIRQNPYVFFQLCTCRDWINIFESWWNAPL